MNLLELTTKKITIFDVVFNILCKKGKINKDNYDFINTIEVECERDLFNCNGEIVGKIKIKIPKLTKDGVII